MATGQTNFFFNNFSSFQEQQLLESLTIEAIGIYGHNCIFIPRNLKNYDQLYGNDDQSDYSTNFTIAMYIKSYDGFKGNGNFLSKFGLEIRDQVVFSIAQKIFNDEIGSKRTQTRPNEGDLIYFPLNNKCYQITYVEKFEFFYQLGRIYTWDMTCELFEYSSEKFNTGIPEIDSLERKMSTDILGVGVKNEAGAYLLTDESDFIILEDNSSTDLLPGDDSLQIQTESDKFIDFSSIDPFSEGPGYI